METKWQKGTRQGTDKKWTNIEREREIQGSEHETEEEMNNMKKKRHTGTLSEQEKTWTNIERERGIKGSET